MNVDDTLFRRRVTSTPEACADRTSPWGTMRVRGALRLKGGALSIVEVSAHDEMPRPARFVEFIESVEIVPAIVCPSDYRKTRKARGSLRH